MAGANREINLNNRESGSRNAAFDIFVAAVFRMVER